MMYIPGPVPMKPMPIDEASVLSGNPRGSGTVLYTTPDGRASVGIYSCTPGKFRTTPETEDMTHLLSGRVVIQIENGETIDAQAGDTYVLPAGKSMVVDVQETITDIYVLWSDQ